MGSYIYYKFASDKDYRQIEFSGTSLTVWEVKRQIILASALNGDDCDLVIFGTDGVEYNDDTTIIPRATSISAKRRVARKGHGGTSRYLHGRPPVRALKKSDPTPAVQAAGESEADAEAAFLAESAKVWDEQKETLSHATRVPFKGRKPANVPEHPPPQGYICYRCGNAGHWIQACPTNGDESHVQQPRIKRTTGIPRSFLQTVEKPADGNLANVYLNADGEYVQVKVDEATWNKFSAKVNASKAEAAKTDKELEERGLLCPIGKHMFVEPVSTPCCQNTYCRECIETALAESDLVCPNCATEDVLLDDLIENADVAAKLKEYEAEKAKEKEVSDKGQESKEVASVVAAQSSTPSTNEAQVPVPAPSNEQANATSDTAPADTKSPTPKPGSVPPQSSSDVKSPLTVAANPTTTSTSTPTVDNDKGNGSDTDASTTSKKRKEAPTEIMAPTAPKAMRLQKEQQQRQAQDQSSAIEKNFIESMEALKNLPPNAPMMPNAMSMGMPMNPMMGMSNPPVMNGMNPMGMPMNNFNNMNPNQGWNGYNNFPNQQQFGNMGGYPNQFNPAMNGGMNNGYGNAGMNGNWNGNGFNGGGGYGGQGFQGGAYGQFPNQQPNQQQDAYERKPVNPHRNKQRKQRAPDFRYV